ncbi:hypothetical protein KM043_002919 [Ampulex compressa]|nr:hypothetical protein KM043_002919 [Ampulex compressa]
MQSRAVPASSPGPPYLLVPLDGPARGWKMGGSRSGRAHLHDMNIMERAGSSVEPGYERALPVEPTAQTYGCDPRDIRRGARAIFSYRPFEVTTEIYAVIPFCPLLCTVLTLTALRLETSHDTADGNASRPSKEE